MLHLCCIIHCHSRDIYFLVLRIGSIHILAVGYQKTYKNMSCMPLLYDLPLLLCHIIYIRSYICIIVSGYIYAIWKPVCMWYALRWVFRGT
jgi:hypothetical protein